MEGGKNYVFSFIVSRQVFLVRVCTQKYSRMMSVCDCYIKLLWKNRFHKTAFSKPVSTVYKRLYHKKQLYKEHWHLVE